ncbi:hypothetical protein [Sphingomonas hengshuiensis]|uniref:Antitoxin of toxin-antitoxin stability system n=1 Tax=Sphingomonas hengshuiensis TaxID=1609977 RepID=A0A7U4LGB8_9SPHN|nr:hypothetical protein [Sphingomonas hengshuiensis]AJP73019.1 antitoxin of toxin-antitoxin stability system [Sphingomonas hengshuiensis]
MSKAAVFTMKLEPDLRAEFLAAAEAAHRPASQVVRELMREFVQRQRADDAHRAFVERKVALARTSVAAGRGREHAAVDADFAARHARIADKARITDKE